MAHWHRQARKQLARTVVVVAALATIATSAAEDPTMQSTATFEVEALEVVGLDIVLNERATRHVQENPMPWVELAISGTATGNLIDSAGVIHPLGTSFRVVLPMDCADTTECVLPFDLDVAQGGDVTVETTIGVQGDNTFLFPANRTFPDEAAVEVVVSR